ncbi:MAG: Glu/Leu/Phe/Val dehydrogenase [Candidatus Marinimicrobia bacterium]|nr:Glu/Leu/Phe/Val dehydrogenase [Candidatus Neomarinimicrobiota bacterium]
MDVLAVMSRHDHEQVVFCNEPAVGLKAIIAIHDTTLGPSLGGCRFYPYPTEEQALSDVLRLSRAMTYKASLAGLNLGGGKSVIIGDPETDRSEALFRAFGRCVDGLGGRYITAADVNTSVTDMEWVRRETQYVTGLPETLGSSGDPSPVTAYGVLVGIKAAVMTQLDIDNLRGIKVAVQGVGHVGRNLCRLLREAGAELFISDINQAAADGVVAELGATWVDHREIHAAPVDVLAPCAMGGALNEVTIPEIKASIIAGAANNQLARPTTDGEALYRRGILYAPDYAVNAGGLINLANELEGYDRKRALAKVEGIHDTLMRIFRMSAEEERPTHQVADGLAEGRIRQAAGGKSMHPATAVRTAERQ